VVYGGAGGVTPRGNCVIVYVIERCTLYKHRFLTPLRMNAMNSYLLVFETFSLLLCKHFNSVEHLLLKHTLLGDGREVHPWIRRQLLQVICISYRALIKYLLASSTVAKRDIFVVLNAQIMTELRVKDMQHHNSAIDSNLDQTDTKETPEAVAVENVQSENQPQDPITKIQAKLSAGNTATPKMRFQSIHDKRPWEANSYLKFYGDSSYTHKVSVVITIVHRAL
jgi:hypothetical protein